MRVGYLSREGTSSIDNCRIEQTTSSIRKFVNSSGRGNNTRCASHRLAAAPTTPPKARTGSATFVWRYLNTIVNSGYERTRLYFCGLFGGDFLPDGDAGGFGDFARSETFPP